MDKRDASNTHFGYEHIRREDKPARVRELFADVTPRYDLLNDLLSLGVHRLWKRMAIEYSGVQRGQRVLDLASGTADLAMLLRRAVGAEGRVVALDATLSMLRHGRDRLLEQGLVCPAVCA